MNVLGGKSVQRSPSGQLDDTYFKIPSRQTDERTSQSADIPIFKSAVTGKRITYMTISIMEEEGRRGTLCQD